MSKLTLATICFGTAFLFLTFVSGCAENTSATAVDEQLVTKHRTQFVLQDEPDEVLGITELREQLEGTPANDSPEATEDDNAGEHGGDHDGDSHEHAEGGHHDLSHDGDSHDHDADDHDADDHGADGQHADGDSHEPDASGHDHDDEAHGQDTSEEHTHVHADGTTCTDPDCEHDHGGEHVAGLGSLDDVTVVGKISKETTEGGASASEFPWEKGQALFVIVDPSIEGGEEEHQHAEGEECPFCAKKKIQGQAVVQFSDDAGPIQVDARELFDIQVDDIVVVHGDAELLGGVLMIEADGIYVRR